jgi:hypothetical protein
MRHKPVLNETTGVMPVSLPTMQKVEAAMVDTVDVQGVAWSPKYRAWRAYLHVGPKQVYHSLHQCKVDAIAARRRAEVEFGKPPANDVINNLPGAFKRFHKAPKVERRREAVDRIRLSARAINRVRIAEEIAGRKVYAPMLKDDQIRLGLSIGRVLALFEYLALTGDVSVQDVERGMQEEVKKLVG